MNSYVLYEKHQTNPTAHIKSSRIEDSNRRFARIKFSLTVSYVINLELSDVPCIRTTHKDVSMPCIGHCKRLLQQNFGNSNHCSSNFSNYFISCLYLMPCIKVLSEQLFNMCALPEFFLNIALIFEKGYQTLSKTNFRVLIKIENLKFFTLGINWTLYIYNSFSSYV